MNKREGSREGGSPLLTALVGRSHSHLAPAVLQTVALGLIDSLPQLQVPLCSPALTKATDLLLHSTNTSHRPHTIQYTAKWGQSAEFSGGSFSDLSLSLATFKLSLSPAGCQWFNLGKACDPETLWSTPPLALALDTALHNFHLTPRRSPGRGCPGWAGVGLDRPVFLELRLQLPKQRPGLGGGGGPA